MAIYMGSAKILKDKKRTHLSTLQSVAAVANSLQTNA